MEHPRIPPEYGAVQFAVGAPRKALKTRPHTPGRIPRHPTVGGDSRTSFAYQQGLFPCR
jgi:hypothetical protein